MILAGQHSRPIGLEKLGQPVGHVAPAEHSLKLGSQKVRRPPHEVGAHLDHGHPRSYALCEHPIEEELRGDEISAEDRHRQ